MSIKLGSASISKMYLGSGSIPKAYLGSNLVFEAQAYPLYSLNFDGSTDYLSMSNANWGAYNGDLFAMAGAFYTDTVSSRYNIVSKYLNTSNREIHISINSNKLELFFYDGTNNNGTFLSSVSLSISTWYSYLIYFDRNNATSSNRIRLWINGTEDTTPTSYTAPTTSIVAGSANFEIGRRGDGNFYWDGLIYQPTFFSGTLPSSGDVFDGTSLKDLSGLSGCYSLLDGSTATYDAIKDPTVWTNNGSVTTSTTIP